jgi:hypothetical protein
MGFAQDSVPWRTSCTSRIEPSDSTTVIIVMSVNMLIHIFQELVTSWIRLKLAGYSRNRAWRPIGCEMLSTSHCTDNRLTDSGKVVSPTHRPHFTPQKHYFSTSSTHWPPLWSSGQSSWLQIRRPGFDSQHYLKKKSSGSGTGSTQPREYN